MTHRRLLVTLFLALPVMGQSVNLTGKVIDMITGAPLAGATVEVIGRDGLPQAASAEDGRFALTEGVSIFPARALPSSPGITIGIFDLNGRRIAGRPEAASFYALDFRPLPAPAAAPALARAASAAPAATLRISKAGYVSRELAIGAWTQDNGDVALSPETFAWKSAKVLVWDPRYQGKPDALVNAAATQGMNVIQVMDRYFTKGPASNANLVALAHAKNIKVFVIFQTFYRDDAATSAANSARDAQGNAVKDSWLNFRCPNEETYKSQRIQDIENVLKTYKPDGISMDFFRYFVFWEGTNRIQTCFDSRCLNKFKDQYGVTATPSAIISTHLDKWTEFKCRTIVDYAARIHAAAKAIKPDVLMNLHTVPWTKDEYGGALKVIAAQDLPALSRYFDYLQPMTYSSILKKGADWVRSVAADAKGQVGSNAAVIPCVQKGIGAAANRELISAPPVNGYSLWPFEEF